MSSPLGLALINQLGYPGVGTIMAGQKIGWLQAALMTLGLLAYAVYFYDVFQLMAPYFADVMYGNKSWNYSTLEALSHPYRWLRILGFVLSIGAWTWSLVSSIQILRRP